MTQYVYVYDFAEGGKDQKDLLGGKGANLAEMTNLGKLGDADHPLLVSVRSGAKFSMPGMMETVLNIGLNDSSVKGLARVAEDDRFAWDSYRRLVQRWVWTTSPTHRSGCRWHGWRPDGRCWRAGRTNGTLVQ